MTCFFGADNGKKRATKQLFYTCPTTRDPSRSVGLFTPKSVMAVASDRGAATLSAVGISIPRSGEDRLRRRQWLRNNRSKKEYYTHNLLSSVGYYLRGVWKRKRINNVIVLGRVCNKERPIKSGQILFYIPS